MHEVLISGTRKEAGLTQDQVCDVVGLSRSTLHRWESGTSERPDPDQVRAVCLALDVPPVEAAIALGYVYRDEVNGVLPLEGDLIEVVDLLTDPMLPDAEREQWIDYLRFLRDRRRARFGEEKPPT